MGEKTGISWTDSTWNPVRGCTKVSAGCKNCYAERFAERWRGVPGHAFEQGFDVRLVPEALELPLRWKKPRRIFVNSMSDLFHESVPDEFIAAVFGIMAASPQHTFQVLTKRPARLPRWFDWVQSPRGCGADTWVQHCAGRYTDRIRLHRVKGSFLSYPWPLPNVWLGVSVEDQRAAAERIPALLATPAAVRFVSAEPLLGPVDLHPTFDGWARQVARALVNDGRLRSMPPRIRWVIVGGESGPGARPCDVAWVRSLVRQCAGASLPCFVKQLGAAAVDVPNGLAGAALKVPEEATELVSNRLRDRAGRDPAEWPADLRVQQWPEVSHA